MSLWDRFKRIDEQSAPSRQAARSLEQELTEQLASHAEEDEKAYPQDVENLRLFRVKLHTSLEQHIKRLYPDSKDAKTPPAAVDSTTSLYLSEDRMSVFLCLLPPLSGGEEATMVGVLEDLRFEGVAFGVDEAVIKKAVSEKLYMHTIPVARGKPPKDGTDAQLKDFFARCEPFTLAAEDGSELDFGAQNLVQAVHKGELICRLTPATPAADGMDVTGKALQGKVGQPLALPKGENTTVSQDGQHLLSELDGALSVRDGRFCVERHKVIFGNVSKYIGNLDYPGSILIQGNVQDALTVRATGDIIIEGSVKDATIISGGNVRIQGGIAGNRSGGVQAAGQVQCKVIEETKVVCGGSIFAEAIVDSDVTCGASVFLTGERGLLVGGQLKTLRAVEARRIGNQAGCQSTITLAYNPELRQRGEQVQKELDESRATLETLRTHVMALRKNLNPNPEQRALLSQLMEQRDLYEERIAKLAAASKSAALQLSSTTGCYVKSEEILPVTIISLGEKSMSVKEPLHNCRIRVTSGALVVTQ